MVNCIGCFVLPLGLSPPRIVPREEQRVRTEDRQSVDFQMFELQLPFVKNLDDHLESPYSKAIYLSISNAGIKQ